MYTFMLIVAVLLALLVLLYVMGRPKKRARIKDKQAIVSKDRKRRPNNTYWTGHGWMPERRSGDDRRGHHDRRSTVRLEDDRRSGLDRRAAISAWSGA